MTGDGAARMRLVGGVAALAVLTGLIWGWAAAGDPGRLMEFPGTGGHEHGGSSVRLSAAGTRVASGLRCPCGCPDLLLACDCTNPKGAAEVKHLITELLSQGRSEAEARIELVNRYGAAIHRLGR